MKRGKPYNKKRVQRPVQKLNLHSAEKEQLPAAEEAEGNTRRASGDPGLSQLPTSHKPIKQEY